MVQLYEILVFILVDNYCFYIYLLHVSQRQYSAGYSPPTASYSSRCAVKAIKSLLDLERSSAHLLLGLPRFRFYSDAHLVALLPIWCLLF